MNSKPRIYLAGPIRHADDHGVGWRDNLVNEYPTINWINPLDKYHEPTQEDKWPPGRIVRQDLGLIDTSDAIYVNWIEAPSCGTPMEVFYAKRCCDIPVAVRSDTTDISPWMEYHADIITASPHDAIESLLTLTVDR